MTGSMLAIATIFLVVWCSVLILALWAWRRYQGIHAAPQPAPSRATPLGKAVWEAHQAARKLDSEITLGSADEITDAAIQAAITAEALCKMIRDAPRVSSR